jgi:transposase
LEVYMTKRKDGPRRAPRTFTREYRREAVQLMVQRREAGISLDQIARELDISPDQLRQWGKALGVLTSVRAQRVGPTAGLSPEEELRRLRRELEVARQERDFLKKAVAFFAKESR